MPSTGCSLPAMDWESGEGASQVDEQQQQQRIAAVQRLLDQNAEAVFKLHGESAPPRRLQVGLRADFAAAWGREGGTQAIMMIQRPPTAACAGLAMLRRQRGGEGAAPPPEEQQLLAEAQRCLQEAAILLPPKVRAAGVLCSRDGPQRRPPMAAVCRPPLLLCTRQAG